jgi:hypothetical protein
MKKGFIFTVMLVGVLVLGFAQSALSVTYRYDANYYITFTGNNFSGAYGSGSTMSGTYSVSGNRLTLNVTGGTLGRNTWNWTVVDANTLRDQDGDNWRKEGGDSTQGLQSGSSQDLQDGPIQFTAVSNSTFGNQDFINGIAWGNGRFVAVGGDGWVGSSHIAYSTDGVTWTAVSNTTFGTEYIRGIAWGNGRFVAVGSKGKIAYSSDGVTWTAISTSGTTTLHSVAWGNGRFVAGGDFCVMLSTDGIAWTRINQNYDISNIAWCNDRFVAGEAGRTISYSTDGTRWTSAQLMSIFYDKIYGVAWGNGRFVAVGSRGEIAYSTDCTRWTAATISTHTGFSIFGIAWGNGYFVVGGPYPAYSVDGITWTTNSRLEQINCVAYGNGRFVVGCTHGMIAYSNIVGQN